MQQYLDVLREVMETGTDAPNRTLHDTRKLFGHTMRFDLSEGFPIITTKKVWFSLVVKELLWFLSGDSDNNTLVKQNVHFWTANAEADYWKDKARFPGDLGRIYPKQWRQWRSYNPKHELDPENEPPFIEIDQIANAIKLLREDPMNRRIIVSAWNPGELEHMALPPCHMMFHFNVIGKKLHMTMYQRSCDMFLGVPFNISSYSLLLAMIAQVTGLEAGEYIHHLGDTHIYHNHYDAVRTQLDREPMDLPELWLNPEIKEIDEFTYDDIKLKNYNCHPAIKAEMAV